MGNSQSIKKMNFEDVQTMISSTSNCLLINTMTPSQQSCLISNTIPADIEEGIVNEYMTTNKRISMILYGRNSNDESVYKKYFQLVSLGFSNVYVYSGGMFEWLLMQDIYGNDNFPTTTVELDLLKYKPSSSFFAGMRLLENGR